jgi:hypothetical protein
MSENVGKFSNCTFMGLGALYYFMEYIFLSIEDNKGIWCGAEGLLVGGERVGRPQQLVFFVSLCKLSRAFWLFMQM